MAYKYIDVPLAFNRQFKGPIDNSMVLTTTERVGISNGTNSLSASRYVGQLVFDTNDSTLYTLKSAGGWGWVAVGSNVTNTGAGQGLDDFAAKIYGVQLNATTDLSGVASLSALSGYDSIYELGTKLSALETTGLSGLSSSIVGTLNSTLSNLDTIAELQSAVDSLSSYKTSSSFLSTTNPTISSGSLKLANGGIVMSNNQSLIDSSRNIYANTLYIGTDPNATYKFDSTNGLTIAQDYGITSTGVATFDSIKIKEQPYGFTNNGTVNAAILSASTSLKVGSSEQFKVESNGNTTVKGATVEVTDNSNSSIFKVDSANKTVTIGNSALAEDANANLTVYGNLSVLGKTTYLDTEVSTMSAVVAALSSDSATTLSIKQTGTSKAVEIKDENNSVNLTIAKGGALSGASTANFIGKLTVTNDISSTQTVYGSAGKFSDLLEVGNAATPVLYVDLSGVGINANDTADLSGYSVAILDAGSGTDNRGTLYVAGSATFAAKADFKVESTIVNANYSITGHTLNSGGKAIANVETVWSLISSLDGGTF